MFPDIFIYSLDMVGIVACAIAGTLLAQHKGLDFFGCILVSMINCIGGGTVRDLLLDRHPLFWMTDLNYVIVISITSIAFQMLFHLSHKIDRALKFFDAIGLAAFSVIGFTVALNQGAHPSIATMMAVCTSIFGGMMRDIICNEIPLVLQQEIYITASILGCCGYLFIDYNFSFHQSVNELVMLAIIFVVRMLAVTYDWHLPSINLRKPEEIEKNIH